MSTVESLRLHSERVFTDTLVFRSFRKCDVFPLFDATLDESFNQHLSWPRPAVASDLYAEIDTVIREDKLNRCLALSICDKTTGEWYGFLRLKPYEDGVEQSVWLHPKAQNRRLFMQVAQYVFGLSFDICKLPCFYSRAAVGNETSAKIFEFYGGASNPEHSGKKHSDR